MEHSGRDAALDVSSSPEKCLLALVWQSPNPGINALMAWVRRGDSPGGLLSPGPFRSLLKAAVLQISLMVHRAALPKDCLVSVQQTKAETELKLKAGTGHAQVCCQGGDRGSKSLLQ